MKHSPIPLLLISLISLTNTVVAKYGQDLVWPTANTAYLEHQEPEAYLQATASGRIKSGDWGCTRNDGSKFHEGVDLKSIHRSANGAILDSVGAIANGTVVHVSRNASESNYGKYVVISHLDSGIEWCSLYAHLNSIESSMHVGKRVKAGETLGIMGNTSSSITIPRNSSHLHLEIGVRLNSRFDDWYRDQHYRTPNKHGSWNGMNFLGVDPLDFYDFIIKDPEQPFFAYFLNEPVSFEILVYFKHRPDFLHRNPIFLRGKHAPNGPGWYHIGLTWYGLPVDWTPIDPSRVDKRFKTNQIIVRSFSHEKPCRNFVNDTNNGFVVTNLLQRHVELLKAGD